MTKLPIPFGNPYTYRGHSGVDYPQPAGTPFRASAPGVVTWLGHNAAGGYFIWVKYDGVGPKVGYHHMPSHAGCPREGARFKAGDRLGYVGNTGRSTGPHLHSEVEGHRTTDGYWKFFDRDRVVGSSSGGNTGGGSNNTNHDKTPTIPAGEEDEDDMKVKFGHRTGEHSDEWMIVHPQFEGGYLVTTSEKTAIAWARLYGIGWDKNESKRYDFNVPRSEYIDIQNAAKMAAKAWRIS